MGCRPSRPVRGANMTDDPRKSKWVGYVRMNPNFFCAEQERRLRRANLEFVESSRDSDDEEDGFQFAITMDAEGGGGKDDHLLIPGLSNDIAELCLMRLPCVKYCPRYRLVSQTWKSLLSSRDFYAARRVLGIQEASVCFVVHGNRVIVFNTVTCSWLSLPPLPHREFEHHHVRVDPYDWWRIDTVAVADGNLFVIGGEESRVPSSKVHRYDFCSGSWEEMASMNVPRSHSAAVTVGSRVYVAGGASAEVYTLADNSWEMVSGLRWAMKTCVGVEHQGMILVKGENVEGGGESQVYDPGTDVWSRMDPQLQAGLTRGPVVPAGSDLVVADWKDLQLKVFNAEKDSWESVGYLPAGISRLMSHGSYLYAFNGRIKVDSVTHRVVSEAPTEVWKLDIGRGIRKPQFPWECIWRGTKTLTKVGALTWAPCSAHCVLLLD